MVDSPEKASLIDAADARRKAYPLTFPVSYEKREYRFIYLQKMTVGEVAAFQAKLRALPDDALALRFPVLRDEVGNEVPSAVLDALDDDDMYELDRLVVDFIPLRFRGEMPSGSDPALGGATAP